MKKFAVACALCATLVAFPAIAQKRTFDGPSVTFITGVDDTSEIGRSHAGALYGGQIEYSFQNENVVFGVEGEITGASTRDCYTSASTAPVSTLRDCRKAGRDLYAGGKIGLVVGDRTLLYGKAGYTNARNFVDFSYTGAPPSAFRGNVSSDGFRVGAGVEKAIGAKLSVKAEYRYSNYDGSYSRHQGVIGLGFRF